MEGEAEQTVTEIARFRKLFPITERYIYFNHAGTGPLSVPAQKAIEHCLEIYTGQAEFDKDEYFDLVQKARVKVACFLNADPTEITFTHNTSQGIYIALMNVPFEHGDEIIVMDEVFPAVRYIVEHNLPHVTKRYVKFSGRDVTEVLRENVSARSKAVVVDYVHFLTGETLDLVALSNFTKEREIYLIVDGIQAIGAMEYDAVKQNVDFLACGAAKWLFGPSGAGFLYVNQRIFAQIRTMHAGWLGARWEGFEDISVEPPLFPDARKYEMGTRNVIGMRALSANIDVLLQFGMRRVHERISMLKAKLRRFFEDSQSEIITPQHGLQSGIIACRQEGDMKRLHSYIQKSGIVISLRNGYLRFSPHFYNTEEEVDQVFDAISRYRG
ncbi:MAG: aminotransferase class V-fold PLP-dependent enzyme [candidate division WOR-3 bacterium]|jgi:selenocysteine lyase/cysteine desulfurase